jgi:Rod binding domain-containing protein
MDIVKSILTEPVVAPNYLGDTRQIRPGDTAPADDISDAKRKQLAKDFESVLLGKMLDQAKETTGNLGLDEEDGASEQVQGLFWMYLAQDIANNGGLGLWKDIYRFFKDMEQAPAAVPLSSVEDRKGDAEAQSLDKNI